MSSHKYNAPRASPGVKIEDRKYKTKTLNEGSTLSRTRNIESINIQGS